MGGIGGGGGGGSSKSQHWNWSESEFGPQSIMTPGQQQASRWIANPLMQEAAGAFQGMGMTPEERTRRKDQLYTDVSDFAGGMRETVGHRAASLGQRGGAVEGAMKNIDAAKIMAASSGLADLESQNEMLKQQKIANLMNFITWAPATAQAGMSTSEGAGTSSSEHWNIQGNVG